MNVYRYDPIFFSFIYIVIVQNVHQKALDMRQNNQMNRNTMMNAMNLLNKTKTKRTDKCFVFTCCYFFFLSFFSPVFLLYRSLKNGNNHFSLFSPFFHGNLTICLYMICLLCGITQLFHIFFSSFKRFLLHFCTQ